VPKCWAIGQLRKKCIPEKRTRARCGEARMNRDALDQPAIAGDFGSFKFSG